MAAIAFPGAEGHGSTTRHAFAGGVSPTIIRVTNLNPDGPGSLKDALESSGPRIVVPEVAGEIVVDGLININQPYCWYAGQVAPSPGLRLREATVQIQTNDVLVQHLDCRRGDGSGTAQDCLRFYAAQDAIFDYCNAFFTTDEALSAVVDSIRCTFSRVHAGEPLDNGWGSKGSLFGSNSSQTSYDITVHHCLFSHSKTRNPLARYRQRLEWAMNVIYNMGPNDGDGMDIRDMDEVDYDLFIDLWSNTYLDGAGSGSGSHIIDVGTTARRPSTASRLYLGSAEATGNIHYEKRPIDDATDVWAVVNDTNVPSGTFQSLVPTSASSGTLTEQSAASAFASIVTSKNVGAYPLYVDAVRDRIIAEVAAQTGVWKDDIADTGGWPTVSTATRSFATPSNPFGDDDGDGYTNIERYIHENYTAAVQAFSYEFPASGGGSTPSEVTQIIQSLTCGKRYRAVPMFNRNGDIVSTKYIDSKDGSIVTDATVLASLSYCKR